jgi:F0F1-type ATP synthase membrane subunit b/b'
MLFLHLIVWLLYELAKADQSVYMADHTGYPDEKGALANELTKDNETLITLVFEKAQDGFGQSTEPWNEGNEDVLRNKMPPMSEGEDNLKRATSEAGDSIKEASKQRWSEATGGLENLAADMNSQSEGMMHRAGDQAQALYDKGKESIGEAIKLGASVGHQGAEYAGQLKEKVTDTAQDAVHNAKEWASAAREKGERVYDHGKEKSEAVLDTSRQAAQKAIHSSKETVEKAMERAKESGQEAFEITKDHAGETMDKGTEAVQRGSKNARHVLADNVYNVASQVDASSETNASPSTHKETHNDSQGFVSQIIEGAKKVLVGEPQ